MISNYSVKELAHLPKHIKAENGGAGKGEDCKGKNGMDCIFEVKLSDNSDDKNYCYYYCYYYYYYYGSIVLLDAELARNNVTYVPSGIITFYNTVC